MNTSTFLASLRSHAGRRLIFRAGREIVNPGYHLTEVKRVAYETMDCGAMTHRWAETQFEIWVPDGAEAGSGRGHMPAGKFLRIIERVEAGLPLNGEATARIHASFAGQPAALYDIDAVTPREGDLWIELIADRTRCKSAERRLASTGRGCCGASADEGEAVGTEASCGCGTTKNEPAAAACCA